MYLLRNIAIGLSIAHALVLAFGLSQLRVPVRRAAGLLAVVAAAIVGFITLVVLRFGVEAAAYSLALTGFAPALAFFCWVSEYRDWRAVFSLLLSSGVALWVLDVASLADFFLVNGCNVLTLALPCLVFPAADALVLLRYRTAYLRLQRDMPRGWFLLCAVALMSFWLLLAVANLPTAVGHRLEYLPHALLTMLAVPLLFALMLAILHSSQELLAAEELDRSLEMQAEALRNRVEAVHAEERAVALWRHDARHFHTALAVMLAHGEQAAALDYLDRIIEGLREDAADGEAAVSDGVAADGERLAGSAEAAGSPEGGASA